MEKKRRHKSRSIPQDRLLEQSFAIVGRVISEETTGSEGLNRLVRAYEELAALHHFDATLYLKEGSIATVADIARDAQSESPRFQVNQGRSLEQRIGFARHSVAQSIGESLKSGVFWYLASAIVRGDLTSRLKKDRLSDITPSQVYGQLLAATLSPLPPEETIYLIDSAQNVTTPMLLDRGHEAHGYVGAQIGSYSTTFISRDQHMANLAILNRIMSEQRGMNPKQRKDFYRSFAQADLLTMVNKAMERIGISRFGISELNEIFFNIDAVLEELEYHKQGVLRAYIPGIKTIERNVVGRNGIDRRELDVSCPPQFKPLENILLKGLDGYSGYIMLADTIKRMKQPDDPPFMMGFSTVDGEAVGLNIPEDITRWIDEPEHRARIKRVNEYNREQTIGAATAISLGFISRILYMKFIHEQIGEIVVIDNPEDPVKDMLLGQVYGHFLIGLLSPIPVTEKLENLKMLRHSNSHTRAKFKCRSAYESGFIDIEGSNIFMTARNNPELLDHAIAYHESERGLDYFGRVNHFVRFLNAARDIARERIAQLNATSITYEKFVEIFYDTKAILQRMPQVK